MRADLVQVAVPRGALLEGTLDLLDELGLDTGEIRSDSRKLLFEGVGQIAGLPVNIITVRPSDVATYVEHGAAHLGITGKDVLMEQNERELYEIADLDFGRCRMVVATPDSDSGETRIGLERMATKYPRITQQYFERSGRQVEIVEVKGSVEIAAIAGMAEGIVDLTATGSTLKANGLTEREEIAVCTARLISNVVAHKLLIEPVDAFCDQAIAWRDARAG